MDVGHDFCHFTNIYPFKDKPDVPVRVFVFPAPAGGIWIPHAHPFPLRNWDRLEQLDEPAWGMKYDAKEYYYGPLPDVTPGHICGTADQWLGNIDFATWLAGGYTCDCPPLIMPTYVSSWTCTDSSIIQNQTTGDITCRINVNHINVWNVRQEFFPLAPGAAIICGPHSSPPTFQVDDDGALRTNQTAVGTLPATTPLLLPIYDLDKVLLGYVPVYPDTLPPGVVVQDDFTDANGTPITAHVVAPVNIPGNAWVVNAGTWEIQSNALVKTATAAAHETCTLDCGLADCTVSADLTVPGGGGYTGLACRESDNANGWYIELSQPSNQLILYEVNGGSFTARDVQALTLVAGSTYTVSVVMSGTSIAATVGATTASYGSATFNQLVTKHGFRCYTGNSACNNFVVTNP